MGEREYLGPHTPKVQKFGEVSWRTYDQVKEESLKFGASLRSAGLVASLEKSTLDKLPRAPSPSSKTHAPSG
jgi:hypothetical protein